MRLQCIDICQEQIYSTVEKEFSSRSIWEGFYVIITKRLKNLIPDYNLIKDHTF